MFGIHVYTHADEKTLELLRAILAQGHAMAITLDDLKAKVKHNTEVAQSAITLLRGISAKLRELANDPVKIQALADELDSSDTDLAAAIVENTPAEPEPTPTPTPTPTPELNT